MKLKIFLLTALTLLLLPVSAHASTFSFRLDQPKSPTNQNNFDLSFTVNDMMENRTITVQCFKKGPSDTDYTLFQTVSVAEGGTVGFCSVTSGILNNTGTYSFKAIATVGSEVSPEKIVTVDYNTAGPGAPVSYSKEKVNSCDYKIKFKTANDGKTVKVQLFRSDTLNISVGSSSVISGANIGPDTEGEIVNSVPQCGKDYYFVIRAVDASDNASGTIGDSFTTTVFTSGTTSSSSTNTETVGAGSAISLNNPSGQVSSGEQGSSVTSTGSAQTSENASGTATPSPEILGTSTDKKNNFSKWLLMMVAVFIGYFISRTLRRSKTK